MPVSTSRVATSCFQTVHHQVQQVQNLAQDSGSSSGGRAESFTQERETGFVERATEIPLDHSLAMKATFLFYGASCAP